MCLVHDEWSSQKYINNGGVRYINMRYSVILVINFPLCNDGVTFFNFHFNTLHLQYNRTSDHPTIIFVFHGARGLHSKSAQYRPAQPPQTPSSEYLCGPCLWRAALRRCLSGRSRAVLSVISIASVQ